MPYTTVVRRLRASRHGSATPRPSSGRSPTGRASTSRPSICRTCPGCSPRSTASPTWHGRLTRPADRRHRGRRVARRPSRYATACRRSTTATRRPPRSGWMSRLWRASAHERFVDPVVLHNAVNSALVSLDLPLAGAYLRAGMSIQESWREGIDSLFRTKKIEVNRLDQTPAAAAHAVARRPWLARRRRCQSTARTTSVGEKGCRSVASWQRTAQGAAGTCSRPTRYASTRRSPKRDRTRWRWAA